MSSLSVKNIRKKFGSVEVLKGVSLEIESGEFLVLVGPSGCGKSTLLNLIAGLEKPSSGDICMGNKRVNDISPKDRNIAMVFQSYALYPSMNVRKNISFGLETRKIPKQEIKKIVHRVSEMLQIGDLLDRKPAQLSGGQRQRVAMGRALARDPDIFLFDEPLSNLDAKLRVEMRTEIKLLHHRIDTTIVYVTHDQIEAMTLADRIAIMKDGVIQQFGTPREIYENPASIFVAGFIGSPSMNFIPCNVKVKDGKAWTELSSSIGSPTALPIDRLAGNKSEWNHKKVILGIRPEQISGSGNAGPNSSSTYGIECRVEVTEPTGPDTLVFTTINNTKITCRSHPDDAADPGKVMRLKLDMSKAVLFDPETGNRIS